MAAWGGIIRALPIHVLKGEQFRARSVKHAQIQLSVFIGPPGVFRLVQHSADKAQSAQHSACVLVGQVLKAAVGGTRFAQSHDPDDLSPIDGL